MSRVRRERARDLALLAPALVTVVLLFGGALAGAVRTSLVPLGGEATLDAWRDLFEDPAFLDALGFTLRLTVVSTLLSAALAVGVALAVRRRGTLVRTLLALPVPVPHLLVAVLAVVWLAPGGLADRVLGGLPVQLVRDGGGVGVMAVYVYKEAPFLALLVLAAMGRGLAEREEAAATLGAGPLERLRWVVWPSIRTPLVVGSIIVGAFVLGSFEVPLTVGPNYPPTLASFAFEATQDDLLSGQGVAAATMLLTSVVAVVLAVVAVRFGRDAAGG